MNGKKNLQSDRLLLAAAQHPEEKKFWLEKLASFSGKNHFPYDYRKKIAGGVFDQVSFTLSPGIFQKLIKLSNGSDYTLNAILNAGLAVLLYKFTGDSDIVTGAPIYKQVKEGDFINTIFALRNPLKDSMTFKELLIQMSQVIFDSTAHQDYPFQILLEDLNLGTSGTDYPLFDTVLLLENIHDKEYIRHIAVNTYFYFLRNEGNLSCIMEYNSLLFEKTTAQRISACFQQIYSHVMENLDLPIRLIDILPVEEKNQLLVDFNNKQADFPRDKTITQFIEAHAINTPDRIAAVCSEAQLTYGELNRRANRLAWLLKEKGVTRDHLVGILCERSLEMMMGILAVWKAGGAYIPIDINYPLDRINTILDDSKAELLLTKTNSFPNLFTLLTEITAHTSIREVIFLDENKNTQTLDQYFKTLRIASLLSQNIDALPQKDWMLRDENQALSFNQYMDIITRVTRFINEKQIDISKPVGVLLTNPLYQTIAFLYLKHLQIPFIKLVPGTPWHEIKQIIQTTPVTTVFSESRFIDELDQFLWESVTLKNYLILNTYDIKATEKETHFKDIWDYVAEESSEAINDYGWSNSYTNEPFSIEEMNEYIKNFKEKLSPFIRPDSRVLDIGCGHGLVLFEIGPQVGYYMATDLSPTIIKKNQMRLQRDKLNHIELKAAAASGISQLGERHFDIVLCSSVIHYFPNTLYLEEVINQAIGLLKDEGIIYLDDLINLRKKEELIQSTLEYKASHPEAQVKTEWDSDLFVDEDFFHDIQQKYPEIIESECTAKTGRIKNELTRFRYDVVLKIDKKVKEKQTSPLKKNRYHFRDIENYYNQTIDKITFIKSASIDTETNYPDERIIGSVNDLASCETFSTENPKSLIDLSNLSYVIYTSGSTGKPKGAMVEHIGMNNHMQAKIDDLQLNRDSIIVQNASHTFDISVWQFFTGLIPGGKTMIYSDDLVMAPDDFIARVIADRVTILEVVPSYLSVLLEYVGNEDNIVPLPLHYLLVTGEEIKPILVKRWFEKYPGIPMVNAYGPTEASDDITHHIMDKPPDRELIPIGKPLQNLNIYIIDSHEQLCPIGVKGEICVSGVGVGRGYVGDKERTQSVFCDDPFTSEPGVRMYKTGDLGRWLPDGTIEFFGRKDFQVKIRGFRIELGEIEGRLLTHPAIKEAVVVDREEVIGNKYLCAYYICHDSIRNAPETEELKEFLSRTLPYYMVPTHFIQLERIPLTPNGKTDRKALPAPDPELDSVLTFITSEMLKKAKIQPWQKLEENKKFLSDFYSADTPVLSKEERACILDMFNNTYMAYPQDKMIHQLLEDQVVKTPDSVAVICEDQQMAYWELNYTANQLANELKANGVGADVIVGVIAERSVAVLIAILAVLKAGGAYLPVGPEYPEERALYMLEDCQVKILLTDNQRIPKGYSHLLIDINSTRPAQAEIVNPAVTRLSSNLAYINYTSGTTGKPKGVMLENRSVINLVYAIRQIIAYQHDDIFLSLITISFDVFLTETILPLSFGAKIVIGTSEQQANAIKTANVLEKEKITVLQATPSMMQSFLLEKELIKPLRALKYLLVTGETFPIILLERVRLVTNARIYNLYGPTEATVWASVKEVTGNQTLNIGKPIGNARVYILGAQGELQPIGVAGELCIGGHGIARGYFGQDDLSREKFIPSPFINGERLYKTGDLAMWLPDGNIEFLGRIDHQVKIRGLRIEPGEIESSLLSYDHIEEALVMDRIDKNGDRFLCAFVVSPKSLKESDLREFLSNHLPRYMIPTMFVQLEKIPLLPNGKRDRTLLQSLNLEVNRKTDYKSPINKIEEKVVEIWSDILGMGKKTISTDANFFELGGHSLKATILMSRVHKMFDTKVSLAFFFKNPTVAGLAEFIQNANQDLYSTIEKVGKKEFYALSSAQNRLFILQQIDKTSTAFNMPLVIVLENKIQQEKFANSFQQLIQRHEILRTSFHIVQGKAKQKIHPTINLPIEYHDLTNNNKTNIAAIPNPSVDQILKEFNRPFDLANAPLMRVGLIKIPPSSTPQTETVQNQHILIVNLHHIISDGVSQGILVDDFLSLYSGQELPPLKLQYKDFSEWQNLEFEKGIHPMRRQEEFWLKQFERVFPVLNLPTDYPRPAVQSYDGDVVSFYMGEEITVPLKKLALAQNATMFMVLLSIYNIMLSKLSHQEDIVVGTVIAGRDHADLEKIIGVFVNVLAMRNFPSGDKSFTQFLTEVRKNSIQAFDNQDFPFETLVEQVVGNRDLSRHPIYVAAFTLNNMSDLPTANNERFLLNQTDLKIKPYEYEVKVSKIDLNMMGFEDNDRLEFSFEFCTRLFKKETIQRFTSYFKTIASQIIQNPGKKLKDIEILSEAEKNQFRSEIQEDREAVQIDFDL